MKTYDFESRSSKYRGNLTGNSWTLCIGAGVSNCLAPSWDELTKSIVDNVFSKNITNDNFKELLKNLGWSFDSLIQSSANQFLSKGKSIDEFYRLIEDVLYGKLLSEANSVGLEKALRIALNNPRNVEKNDTIKLADFFEKNYSNTTLLTLAKTLLTASEKDKLPRSVISFNAEMLLYVVIEILQRRNHYLGPPPHSHPEYYFRPVLRTLGGIPTVKVPIYHIHGVLKPRVSAKITKSYDSRDKLVFLEEDYLKISKNSGSWPETVFMFNSQISKLVFWGLSMSDPNIRRWLSFTHEITVEDVMEVSGEKNFTPQNMWITTKPNSQVEKKIKAIGLRHLGVRAAWIDNWSEVGKSFENLLAI